MKKRVNPNYVFDGTENGLIFDQYYDFNGSYNDFKEGEMSAVLSEIQNLENIAFNGSRFAKLGSYIHPRQLIDYFDKVGIEINVFRSVGGWKYKVETPDEVVERGAMFPSRSCAEYIAFITALNYRNEQITPNVQEFISRTKISEVSDERFEVNLFGLPLSATIYHLTNTDQTHEIIRGRINGIFHSWFIHTSEVNHRAGNKKDDPLVPHIRIGLSGGINGKKTTDETELLVLKSEIEKV